MYFLAYHTAGNAVEIDRLFRQSKLYRGKWERKDYSAATIPKAIEGCEGRFNINARPLPPYLYYDARLESIRVSKPMLAKYFRENERYVFVRDSAKGGVLRFVYDKSGVYKLHSDDMLCGRIKKYITDFDEIILQMSDVGEVFQQFVTNLVYEDGNVLNANESVINFTNGVLNLNSMRLLPHSPDYLSTIQIPCKWTLTPAPTPCFDNYIGTLANSDTDVITLLCQFMGACMSNVKGWRFKKALFLVGPVNTGKSILRNLIQLLLGRGNYAGIDLKELEARFGTSNIYLKRLAGTADMSYATVDEMKVFKKSTGGDSLFAEFKGDNGFEFVYDGLLWFCMNRLPKFGGDDGQWVDDRIMVVNCGNVIPPEKQDKLLLDKLYAEREGIVYKCVMALKDAISNGYTFAEPNSVTVARAEYKNENSTVISFWSECIVPRKGEKLADHCTVGKIYNVYRAWCYDNNHGYCKTSKEFREGIAELLGARHEDVTVRRSCGVVYKDFTIAADIKQHYIKVYGYDNSPEEDFLQ